MAFVGNILQNPPAPAMDVDSREGPRAAGRGNRSARGRTSFDGRFAAAAAGAQGGAYATRTPPTWYAHLMHDSQFPRRPSLPASASSESSSSGAGFLPSLTRGEPRLLVSNNDHFVKLFALRSAKSSLGEGSPAREEAKVGAKRLTNVGGVKINTAANHCKSGNERAQNHLTYPFTQPPSHRTAEP